MSRSLPKRVLYHGKDEPSPEQIPLSAGPLSLIYESGDLRYIKLGGREVIRRIYAAVRDRNWSTISGQLQNVKMDVREDSFRISYDSEHKEHEIHFIWHGEIIGESDGRIGFTFDGEARTTFLKNRIGFCVLHPIRECAGASCRVEYVDGTNKFVILPKLVAAEQPVKDIHDLKAIAHEAQPGVWAEVGFEGDVFEMEDQRNWIDASYKTFCTPLKLPFPVEIKAGRKIRQRVTVKLVQMPDAGYRMPDFKISGESENRASDVVNFELGDTPVPLPSIGFGASSDRSPENHPHKARLKTLCPAHLRVDVHLSRTDWGHDLHRVALEASLLDVPLELGFHIPKEWPAGLDELQDWIGRSGRLPIRWLVFSEDPAGTTAEQLALARVRLKDFGVPIGGGADADFYQLNQSHPPADLCDFICWSMNPQVHAFDNSSLAETPVAIRAQIESARAYFPGKPLVVSPVTLKPRSNLVATGKEVQPATGQLPLQVDPRQMSLFGAAWTLAAFKYLAESRVDSVTFYETTGWQGVMETETGSLLPDKFRSIPGGVFPLYHVLADIGEFAGGEIVVSRSSDPLKVEGLVMQKADRQRVMLANMTAKPRTVIVKHWKSIASLKRLNETNAELAMREPEKFRAEKGEALQGPGTSAELNLMPYELLRMDF
jgi:hypothetical protein